MEKKKKQLESKQSSLKMLGFSIIALVWTYIFASWAIDSGSLVAHVLAYASVYYAIYYAKETIKLKFSK